MIFERENWDKINLIWIWLDFWIQTLETRDENKSSFKFFLFSNSKTHSFRIQTFVFRNTSHSTLYPNVIQLYIGTLTILIKILIHLNSKHNIIIIYHFLSLFTFINYIIYYISVSHFFYILLSITIYTFSHQQPKQALHLNII